MKNRKWTQWIMVGVMLGGLFLGLQALGSKAVNAFCRPPAAVAAGFLGLSSQATEAGGSILRAPGLEVRVGESCSGMSFFLLMSGLLAWSILRRKQSTRTWLGLVLVIPAAFAITLLANAIRIILAVYAHHVTAATLGSAYQHATHLGVGILVFLPILLLTSFLLEKRTAAA